MRNTIKYFCAMILVIIILGNHSIVVANSIAENIKEKDNKTEESTSNTVNNIDEKTTEDTTSNISNNELEKNTINNEEIDINVNNNNETDTNLSENKQNEKDDKKTESYNDKNQNKTVVSSQVITSGIYKIETILNNTPAFDITDGAKNDGAQIQLWDYLKAKQQKFEIIYRNDGYYRIKSIYSGKILAVSDKNVTNGTSIIQKTEEGTDDEKWIIKEVENGVFEISSKINQLNIDIPDYNAVNGQKLQMHYYNGSTAQKFKIIEQDKKISDGIYQIDTILRNKPAFDITDGSFENNVQVQLWDYLGAEQQKVEITSDKDGFYEIKSIYTGKVLAVSEDNPRNGTKLIQKVREGKDTEKWNITYEDNGEYSISSKIDSNLNIDIPDYNAVNGQKLQMHYYNGSSAQMFTFKAEIDKSNMMNNGDYTIYSAWNSSEAFDITDGSKEDGAQIQIWQYLGAYQQKFSIEKLEDGFYKIISKYTGKALTIEDKNNIVGSKVIQQEYTNLDTQKWKIKAKNDNKYIIVSKIGEYAIELQHGNNGAKAKINNISGNISQIFTFTSRRNLTSTRTIEDGIYKIETVLNNKPAFDITDGAKEDKAKIQLWDYLNADQQKFKITLQDDGYYRIKSIYSEKVVAISEYKASNGSQIIQKTEEGTDDEKWIINDEGNGQYSINSKINSSSIEIPNGNGRNGQKIQLSDWDNSNAQKFIITRVERSNIIEDGIYRIAMYTNENQSFDIDSGKRNNGTNVQLWEWAGEKSYQQQFKFIYDQFTGSYVIYNVNTGKVLDVQNAGYTAGTNIWQYEPNGTDAQKWFIEINEDGSYSIKSKLNGLYIDVKEGKLSNGQNVQLYVGNRSAAQKFKFIKQSDKAVRFLEDGIYRIASRKNNNIGFDITDGSKEDNAQIQLWDYIGASQEEFNVYYEDGYYYISSIYSKKVIQAGNGIEIITQATKDTSNKCQKWIMQPNNGSYNIISKATGLYIDITGGKFENGNKIQTYYENGNIAQLFDFKNVSVVIDETKYLGIKERINELKKKHPNWKFEILYTTVDFNTAIQAEYSNNRRNLVYTPEYKDSWIAPNPYVNGVWASASYSAIAYFMDVRNFLNDVDIFQFLDLGDYKSSGATIESIQYQVNNTFLKDSAEDIRRACENTNINPYYVIARLFQEQGRNGSVTINMDGGDGKRYYNPFNINAEVGKEFSTGLAKAKRAGWDTLQKGLEGGIKVLKSGYIDRHQNTLYLNKFDVNPASGTGMYVNQYMQNLSAAYSEGHTMRSSYVSTNTLDNEIKFIIPVYENMPSTPSEMPTGEKGPINVKVVNTDMGLALRREPSTASNQNIIRRMPTGTILLSIERRTDGWHKVITEDGIVGYCYSSNLQNINDVTNCNEKVKVKTNDKIGTNVRIGPGTDYDIIKAIPEESEGIRILKGKYFANGYYWDEVIFNDGTKGFVATNYLIKID